MTDEVLKRRLIGAAVLLLGAILLAALLPKPGSQELEEGVSVVTVGLDEPPAAEAPTPAADAAPAPQADTEPPANFAAPAEPAGDSSQPEVDMAQESEGPPQAAAPVPVTAPEPKAPPPAAAPQAPAQTATPRPTLRMEPAIIARPEPAAPAPAAPPAASAPKPAPAAPAPKPAAPAPSVPHWTVQVGSFGDIDNARLVQDKLKAAGIGSILSPAETTKGTLYRVRAGSFASREAANAALARVQGLGYAQAAVKEN
ncbi:MAG TPA: SPOR domain-containing protein [Candidatus Binatia bacterium]|nr:SPOR domain-containing protein [Candidatus Binatia bacterium]